jgi:hypothetical protein
MGDFAEAQKLFRDYEKGGKVGTLDEAIQILDEVIESGGQDTQRALNLKSVICRNIADQIGQILTNSDIENYLKKMKDMSQVADFLCFSLNKEDADRLAGLIRIRSAYCKDETLPPSGLT